MKNIIKLLGTLLSVLSISSCNNVNNLVTSGFGDFSYNGRFLKEYATTQIDVETAKNLVDISYAPTKRNKVGEELSENMKTVLTKYASLTATVKYYISNQEEQQVRVDFYQGSDFKFLLETNHYEPFGQMSVRYLFVDDDLLDDMERQNQEFLEEYHHIVSPFNEPFTYHESEDETLIVQTHSFAELPASIGGGIGSTFRQDCELIFDVEGKITFWQSSLGIYTSTPTGTVKEGYIFEVEFNWEIK